jgi:outer membrane protein assembly factor BamD
MKGPHGFILFFLFLSGCVSPPPPESAGVEEKYAWACQKLDKGATEEAIAEFKRIIFEHPGSEYLDDARFGLAETYFKQRDYILAASEYKGLIRDFPSSPFADDSHYKAALCYFKLSPSPQLDQKYTNLAIEEFKTFLEDHPQSRFVPQAKGKLAQLRNKLAEKTYKSGLLYYKMGDWKAAKIYYQTVLDEYEKTDWVDDAHYGLGKVWEKQGEREKALREYKIISHHFPYGNCARKALKKIKKLSSS